MRQQTRTKLAMTAATLVVVWLSAASADAQQGATDGEWRSYAADTFSTKYAPLDHITADNFGDLEVAWVFRGDNFSPHANYTFKSTPSYNDGVLYTTAGYRRMILAIDPSSQQTGGALLGDRYRVRSASRDPGVYIRSMAARNRLGGLADATSTSIEILSAVFDFVFIETVGVGQAG